MAEEKKPQWGTKEITVTNRGPAPHGFYDAKGEHVVVQPGAEVTATVPEPVAELLQRGHDTGSPMRMGSAEENKPQRDPSQQQGLRPADQSQPQPQHKPAAKEPAKA